MSKLISISLFGVCAAILLGFLGAAAMATDTGQSFAVVVGVLIVLIGTIESTEMISHSRRG